MKNNKPVGIWIRVSTEDQAQGDSPEHHEKRARLYAEAKGWRVKEVYHLEAVSGKSVMDRPETQRMLQDIRAGHITGLIFSKLARLARNTRELLDFADIFREQNADLVSLQEAIDTSSPAGRLFYTMVAAMAQWEREEIADRVAASVPIRAKLGKPLGGQGSFGYRWDDGKLVPDPQEAPVRKLIYELFVEHRRKKTVARLLNEAGHRTRNGSEFSDTTVERLLRDPTAKGFHRANYTKSLGDNKKWVPKPEKDWILRQVEPIVAQELWDRCNRILDEQRQNHKRPARKAVHLFTGFVFCHCGQKMYVPSNSPKYICYQCRNKIGVADLETIFHEQLKAFFFSPEEVAGYLDQANQQVKQRQQLIDNLREEERKLNREMDKMMQLYLDDELPKEGFGRRWKPMEERLKQIQDQIPALQGELDFLRVQSLSSDEILHQARNLYSRWPQLDSAEKRRIIENITQQVTVGAADVTIDLCYLPSPSEMMADSPRDSIPALPFYHLALKAPKPASAAYPLHPATLGDHIRKRRLDLGLLQRDVADLLGATEATVCNWENGQQRPSLARLPRIAHFLGYMPDDSPPLTLAERIIAYRRSRGLSQDEFAWRLGADPSTVRRWERGRGRPSKRSMDLLRRVVTGG